MSSRILITILIPQKKINWLKGFDIAMKNQVTDQYSYQEKSEQIKLRSYFEKQHQDTGLRNRLPLAKG